MTHKNSWFVAGGSALFCLLYLTAPAAAQSSTSTDTASTGAALTEVVVTARKIVENNQNVPISVTALSGVELAQRSITTFDDLQWQVPSLYTQQAVDDPQSLTITMRGRKQNDVTLAVDPAVGLYVDGLNVPRTLGMAGSLLDINRVEVLRGPQGTLYGRNTTGGAISFYTNDPTHELGGSFDITGGNYGYVNLIGIANIPLTDDLAARFVLQRSSRDGYGSSEIGEGIGSEDSQYYRAKLRWTPSETVAADLSAHYESNHTHGAAVKLVGLVPAGNGQPAGGASTLEVAAETGMSIPESVDYLNSWVARSISHYYDNGSTTYNFSDLSRWDVALNLEFALPDDLKFRSISGAQGLHRESFFGSPIPVTLLTGAFHTSDTFYSQEFQLLQALGGFNWVAGLYGGYETGRDRTAVELLPVINPGLGINDSGIRNGTAAAYGQATWEFVPTWRLTGGARYSVDSRRADNSAFIDTTCVVPAPGVESTFLGPAQCPRTFKDTFHEPTWLISLDHKLARDVLAYVKAAKGYRSGGQNEGGAIEIETFAPFPPETNVEYELGVKSEFLDHRIRLNVAGYLDKYKNLQVTTAFIAADGNFATAVTSAARATIGGAELEADFVIDPRLTLRAWGAFTDAHYDYFVDITGDRSGEPFEVPRWTGNLGGRFLQPTSAGDLSLQLDYGWRSATVLDGTAIYRSQVTQGGYGLLNARINLHVNAWNLDVALWGTNLTAKKYLTQASSHESFGVNFGYAGQPAFYGLEVIKKFGR